MKRVVIAVAASFLSVGAMSGVAYAATDAAATEQTQVDQAAVDALAAKIAEAVKALGESPTEEAVLSAIETATAGADIGTISAALDKVAMDSSLPAAAKTAVSNAASDAKLALKESGTSTGSVTGTGTTGNAFGSGQVYSGSSNPGAGGGSNYVQP